MPILPVTHQSWLFAPPLDMPLQVRLENRRFDSLRRRRLPTAPPCTTGHVIPSRHSAFWGLDVVSQAELV